MKKKLSLLMVALVAVAAFAMQLSHRVDAEAIEISPESGDIAAALATATEGKTVGDITINLTKGVTYTIGSSIVAPANIIINGNGATIDASALTTPFIQMSTTPAVEQVASGQYVIKSESKIDNVKVTGLTNALISNNNKPYAFETFTISNSVFNYKTQGVIVLNFSSAMAINFNITRSTFYSESPGTNNFIAMSGKRPWQITGYEGIVAKMTVDHCTFYNVAKSNQFFNTNTLKGQANYKYEMNSNIFVNVSNKKIYGNMTNNKNQVITDSKNTYLFGDAFFAETNYNGDEGLQTNPGFKDAANGDFTVATTSDQYAYKTGDPRWIAYAINIAEGIENGTVVPDKTAAPEGAEVTLTITPNDGYELDAISVTGVTSDIAVAVTDGKFTMPADAVTVNATFKKLPVDVTIAATDITDGDITAAIATKADGAPVKNLSITLAEGGSYTVTESIVPAANVTINGSGATIDASALTAPFIQMSATPAVAANEQNAYPIDGITIKDVTINGLAQSLVDAKNAIYYMKGITIDNSVINVSGSKHIIDFQGKGLAEVLSISNSTLWASDAAKHTGRLYQQQSGKKPAEVGAEQLKVSIANSTLYNISNNQNYVGYYRENSKTYHSFEVLNSVIVNSAASGYFVTGLNQKQKGASSTWNVDGNIFNFGNADTSDDEVKNSATDVVKNSIAGVVTFTSAETPDFGGNVALSWGAEQPAAQPGDPRWKFTYSQKGLIEDGKYFVMGLSYDKPQQWLGGGKLSDFGVEFTATFDATAKTYTLQTADGKYLQSDLTLGETAFGWTIDNDATYGQNIYTIDGDKKKYIAVDENKNLVLTEDATDATIGWGFFYPDYFWAMLAPRVVVGSTELTGTAEAYQADISNAMVQNEMTGLWEISYKLVEVTEDKQPEFKVALNGDATKAYPAEAHKITLADFGAQTTPGLYNVTLSYNDEGNIVSVSGIKAEPEDVVVAAADIAAVYGDINAAIAAASKGKLVKSLTINLGEKLEYTVSKPIVATGSVIINGNGSKIDASLLEDAFIKMSDEPVITPDEKGAMRVDAININGVEISGLKYQLFYANKQKYLIGKMTVDNSVVGIDGTNKKTILDFKGGGLAEDLTISNSTIWANPTNAVNGGLYSTESGSKIADLGATKNEITITNSTLYNIANGKPVATLRQNSQDEQKYTVKNNIIVNCGATSNGLGQFLKSLNARNAGKDANWDVDGNVINYTKGFIAEEKVGSSEENIKNAVPAIAIFADADQGDFNVSFIKDPRADLVVANVGDPRWTIGTTTDAYSVGVLDGIEHATITVDKSFSLADELITVTVVPEQGYKVTKVNIKVGNTNLKAEQADPAKDVYTFTMPAMNVTVGAEMEIVATDFVINVESGDITEAINKEILYNEGDEVKTKNVKSLTVNLKKAGAYTITSSISCGGAITVNGVKDAVIDASALTVPFIAMSQTPVVEPVESGQYVITEPIAIKNVTITGLDNALIADGGVAYAFNNVTIENCVVEALQTQNYTFDFSKSMPVNFTIKNSTLYSKVATGSKNFMSISGQQPSKITGYEGGKFEFINNTFYNCATTKQFINTNSIKGKGNVNRVWKNNIFVDCGNKQIWDKFDNGNSPREVENNTYWYNGQNAGEKYDTDVILFNPYLKDAPNADFAVGYKTEQAEKKTGDQRWGTWVNDVYLIEVLESAGGVLVAPPCAEPEELVQIIVKPNEGYRLKADGIVAMMSKTEFEIFDDLTFYMPAADVTLSAEFELIPVFAVTIAEGIENGTVVADKTEAVEGDVVTLTITPNDGFELDYVTVTGVNTNISVPVEDGKFTMPADAVTVNAAFKATATGINGVKADALENAVIYNLQGVRVEKARKGGVYIVNGKKVAIK